MVKKKPAVVSSAKPPKPAKLRCTKVEPVPNARLKAMYALIKPFYWDLYGPDREILLSLINILAVACGEPQFEPEGD